jgi:hypothetical protein
MRLPHFLKSFTDKLLPLPVAESDPWLDDTSHVATDHDLLTENLRLAGELDESHDLSRRLTDEIVVLRNKVVDQMATIRIASELGIKACDVADDLTEKLRVADEANAILHDVIALRDADIVYLKALLAKPSAPPKCKKHPKYQAKSKPRVACPACWKLYRFAKKTGEFASPSLAPLRVTRSDMDFSGTAADPTGAKRRAK